MSLKEIQPASPAGPLEAHPAMTPAGIQRMEILTRRRIIVFALNTVTYLVLMAWLASVLGNGGWSVIDGLIFICFAMAAPWSVLGFWNAVMGVWILHGQSHGHNSGLAAIAPYAAAGDLPTPIQLRTAIMMTIYNEDAARAITRLAIVRESVERTGEGHHFSYFVITQTFDFTQSQRSTNVIW